jgi:N-acyl homoserine lactone hydrolase
MKRFAWIAVLFAGCLPPIPKSAVAPSLARAEATVGVCRLTGEKTDRALFIGVNGGSGPWHQCIGTVVVKRPDGLLVIDPAFGESIGEDLANAGLFWKLLFGSGQGKTPVVQSMEQAGIDPYAVKWIALTHAHWDHTGGIRDLARAQIFLSRAEQKAYWNVKGYFAKGAMPHHLKVPEGRYAPFEFDGPPVLGFAASKDLFGDGSVVALPTPGHTPGSTSYLVRGDDGKAWLFIGDAAWTYEGVTRPAHKNPLVVSLLDDDAKKVAETLGQLHAVYENFGLIPECTKP